MSECLPPASYAFFDLDGTLLPHDTQLLFANHVLRAEPWRRVLLAPFFLAAPFAALKLLRSREMKRVFLTYLAGMSPERLGEHVTTFVEKVLPPLFYPELLEAVERHKNEGRTLILNSASPQFWVKPLGDALGFDHSFGTLVEVPDSGLTPFPEIDGENNTRAAKLPRMAALLGPGFDPAAPEPIAGAYTYTDGYVDLPLLACAEHGICVNPGSALTAEAALKGWTVLRPKKPFCCKAHERFATVAMALGLSSVTDRPE
jgi:HAD superfamily hydrolase (TIGR01490 family)